MGGFIRLGVGEGDIEKGSVGDVIHCGRIGRSWLVWCRGDIMVGVVWLGLCR